MAATGRIRRRLLLAIVLTALIPLLVAIWLASATVRRTSALFFADEVGERLDQSLGLYQELARTVKASMRNEARAMALDPELGRTLKADDRAKLTELLQEMLKAHPDLVSLSVQGDSGSALASADRGRPLDAEREHGLTVTLPIGDEDSRLELVTLFATDRARFAGLESMGQFVDNYKKSEVRTGIDRSLVLSFSVLLGITVLGSVLVGTLLSRSVVLRISELARATRRVGAGDLRVRVTAGERDELDALALAFNQMLEEIEDSRARLEYLQRITAWQEMARRLAHEIKNPLTPIQLAVQDVTRRYDGSNPEYRKLLETTLEIVEDEVGTLRRLVGEFSSFARLPQARPERADLTQFLREQAARLAPGERESVPSGDELEGEASPPKLDQVKLRFELARQPVAVLLDAQMMKRVLVNLVTNAVQATEERARTKGAGAEYVPEVVVRQSREGDYQVVDVDDNGPGIAADARDRVFDPYVTTKADGTGLGLAIVKKIVVEHGGTILATDSPAGGARVRIRIPAEGTAAFEAASELLKSREPSFSG